MNLYLFQLSQSSQNLYVIELIIDGHPCSKLGASLLIFRDWTLTS